MPRNFSLGDHFERLIDGFITGGRYNNASEVVRQALRLLEERELERAKWVEEVRRIYPLRPELGDGVRGRSHGNYLIVFKEREGGVMIESIIHGARDLTGFQA